MKRDLNGVWQWSFSRDWIHICITSYTKNHLVDKSGTEFQFRLGSKYLIGFTKKGSQRI